MDAELSGRQARAQQGNLHKEADKLARQGKLFVRDRVALLLDEGSFVEDALLANADAEDLPADGVVTGVGSVDGRPVCVVANDPTVKAGSWGARTVEKIMGSKLPTIGVGQQLEKAVKMLERMPALLVLSGGRPLSVITRTDVLSYFESMGGVPRGEHDG